MEKPKITSWRSACMTCGQIIRPFQDRECVEALAWLHKTLNQSHHVLVVGVVGTSSDNSEEVVAARGLNEGA